MARKADNGEEPLKKGETPLSRQFNQIKAKYPGAILLFRVGDFYETFGQDAVKASKILGIVLTRRNNGNADAELAGFPHHSLDTYLPKLVRAGERVAICDQLEDPANVKGIVKRGVTELVTPGVSFNDQVLDNKRNNYVAAISVEEKSSTYGIALLDISTGEFMCSQGPLAYIQKLVQSFLPAEILYPKKHRNAFIDAFGEQFHSFTMEEWIFTHEFTYPLLTQHFKTKNLKGFGIENSPLGIISAGVILHYLAETEHRAIGHISSIQRIEEDKYVWLDRFTIRNLELIHPTQEGGVPLIALIDQTLTAMGGRLLRKWLVLPLKDLKTIEQRQEGVAGLLASSSLLDQVSDLLKPIGDVERMISKVAAGRINPRELNALKKALQQIPEIKTLLSASTSPSLSGLANSLDTCGDLVEKIDTILREDPPVLMHQGGMIKSGYLAELDELHGLSSSGKNFLADIQKREIERTGITSLKVSYNKVFGYYLEVTNAHKDRVPPEWIRKQTLVNAERYITEELKIYEEKILSAEDKISVIEFRLFQELVQDALGYITQIQQNALGIATLDVVASFATVAKKNNYVRPLLNETEILDIKGGRHPVIEKQLPAGENYVPNDIYLDDKTQQIMMITGPNMAGKSALLRQTALIVLLAQMGSYVPAESATLGLVDKVFTRVGASDNLSKGESTFMVEMTETAAILNNLSSRSLVLLDEIGRGTSTYDGVSMAWAIAEHLHNHPAYKAKTLFATHYHELNELTQDFPRIQNFHVSVKEVGNKIIFLRKLLPGGSAHSFGIHVAQLAGMPTSLVLRAHEILQNLEKDHVLEDNIDKLKEMPKANYQMSLFGAEIPEGLQKIEDQLKELDVNSLSPIEALLKLNELKRLL
ncbi:DNA mismatch repair protein MutS [Aquirufa antheringensis]|uniref:DNA mismatch repair protein MutS n=1 Tax=Aquirufa antheringensis TaxID=2516559 RepID=A0A4Q9B9Q5_9BACT|nr:DNA mismatch repair protein MutS [Aquirufa antheringensis]MCZ2486792.1 DNA mismatch repair protein MutS [Aquirufa antheringensis]TBH72230.1 DNA mismatch repair protein MutS [Aquirufa antheringensis]